MPRNKDSNNNTRLHEPIFLFSGLSSLPLIVEVNPEYRSDHPQGGFLQLSMGWDLGRLFGVHPSDLKA